MMKTQRVSTSGKGPLGTVRESMSVGTPRLRWRVISAIVAVSAAASGCAAAVVQWDQPAVVTRFPAAGPVIVMEPIWQASETGNTSRDFRIINRQVVTRILAILREGGRQADIDDRRQPPTRVLPGYPLRVDGKVVLTEELNAASRAYEHGAAYLLVPTIVEWKEMRTDDPIGAFLAPHSRIGLTLRLMRLDSPAQVGRVVFKNRARLTLNQPADRLLNGRFRKVVLHLVSGSPPI
jgi:hypothetical protein